MPTLKVEDAIKRVKSLRMNLTVVGLKSLIVPLTAHIASLISISVWYTRGGSFNFDPYSRIDWFLLSITSILLITGIESIIKELKAPGKFTITRDKLASLIAMARFEAETSVINIGGDLSWLSQDIDSLREIKAEKPSLKLMVFYDRNRVPRSMTPLLSQAESIGIDLVPYPDNSSPSIRGMLIDREVPDNIKVYMYRRAPNQNIGEGLNKFVWQQYGDNDQFMIEAISNLVNVIEKRTLPPIRIGISGLNNVGKSLLASRIHDVLDRDYDVKVIGDQFRVIDGGISIRDNFIILLSQVTRELQESEELCIFDRTSVDNLCFLKARLPKKDKVAFAMLAPRIASIARKYDLIFDIQKKDESYIATKHVQSSIRKTVRAELTNFFVTHDIHPRIITIDSNDFEQSIENGVESMYAEINNIIRIRRMQA